MAVARITQVIGASPHSWEDAIRNASSGPTRRCVASPASRCWKRTPRWRARRSPSIGPPCRSRSCSRAP